MSAKKNILIICDWFLPGYMAGGPIQSVATLTKELSNDFNFKIITTDRDFKSDKAYDTIVANKWTRFEDRDVFYISPENITEAYILEIVKQTPHDVIYLNSLYSKFFSIIPLQWKRKKIIDSKIILAPRGMLGDGALAIKPVKKRLFIFYAKCIGLVKGITWQSTSAQETKEIKKRIGNDASIVEISNLPNSAKEIKTILKNENTLKLCFISRISEKKNLNYAIEVLKTISNYKIELDVFGPIEDANYWETCKTNAKGLPQNITFNYNGILKPHEIGSTVQNYHALFLPTLNENYGHIIVETLQHGRMVILSDQTPWRELSSEHVGYDISLDNSNEFKKAIEELCLLNQTQFDEQSTFCINYIKQKLNVDVIKNQYINLFNK